MKIQVKVSEHWLEGFAEAAKARGLNEAQIPVLYKIAQYLQARASNPERFDAGADEVMSKAAAGMPAGWLVRKLKGLKTLGLLGGGALAATGIMSGSNILGDEIENANMFRRNAKYRDIYAKTRWNQMINGALPGMSDPVPAGRGKSNYAISGVPY